MLRPEITMDDILFITIMITMIVIMIMSYHEGRIDGYHDACKVRRHVERQIRRMN